MKRAMILIVAPLLGMAGCARDIPRPAGAVDADEEVVGADAATGPDRSPSPAEAAREPDGGAAPVASTYDQVKAWAEAYRVAHPGRGGKDWDINAKTAAQLAADPAARQLLSVCGAAERPVFPMLAWEYGGSDHSWINPAASALVYCVYVPAKPSTDHWRHDVATDRVTADVYLPFPEQNPCKDRAGRDQVAGCIGDPSNFEILVDTASLNDGADVGLALANASTELKLILRDGSRVSLLVSQ